MAKLGDNKSRFFFFFLVQTFLADPPPKKPEARNQLLIHQIWNIYILWISTQNTVNEKYDNNNITFMGKVAPPTFWFSADVCDSPAWN